MICLYYPLHDSSMCPVTCPINGSLYITNIIYVFLPSFSFFSFSPSVYVAAGHYSRRCPVSTFSA